MPNQRFGCTEYKIGYFVIDKFQYWFDNYKAGERDTKQFLSDIQQYNIDTNLLSPNKIKSFVSVFSGLKGGKKVVVVDANNDDDFTNDTVYEFDTLTTEKYYRGDTLDLAPLVKVRYESFNRGEIISKYTFLRVKPYDLAYSHPTDLDRKLTVYSVPFVHREGVFRIGESNFKVTLLFSPKGHTDDYRLPYLKIQIAEKEYEHKEAPAQIGETAVVDNHVFTVISCNREGSIVKLIYKGYQENREGGLVNNRIPTLQGKSFDNSLITIQHILDDKKYVLLDFWGSWCEPCIRSMPALKMLYTQVDPAKIQFVGIDYEYNTAGQARAQKQLAKFDITWPQVAELSTAQTPSSFLVSLNIKNYPTFTLISPDGKVLVREIGEDALPKIVETFKKIGVLKKP
ncbi:hypothetical protein GCM10023187_53970 [Nibrella viscosa]|uniref:Thioredoxin domain-containing protein n=2 Tax=Nibrella viscosa TaxID=1084524 RepID=A0ABP8L006_9BACT